MTCPVIELACQLIEKASISPDDQGCQVIMAERLAASGFEVEPMRFGDTDNLWSWHQGPQPGPTLVFAGHTDVVPTGNSELWTYPPFTPVCHDGFLYGRGSADMKGSLAAMLVAAENFVAEHPNHRGRLAFLITADEEASAVNGTVKVVNRLIERQEKLDYCLVGEPSSSERLGDVVKNGRRGSLTAELRVRGVQGHVAYPHLADNPIHNALAALQELVTKQWDNGNRFFPPTSMQIANMQAGTGSSNVIPGECYVQFNFRFSTELNETRIKQQVEQILDKHELDYHLDWTLSGQPFLTPAGELVDAISNAVQHYSGFTPQLQTTGGTSDGRFIALTGAQVVELGPLNTTIHQVDERVSIADLQLLSRIYQRIMGQLLA